MSVKPKCLENPFPWQHRLQGSANQTQFHCSTITTSLFKTHFIVKDYKKIIKITVESITTAMKGDQRLFVMSSAYSDWHILCCGHGSSCHGVTSIVIHKSSGKYVLSFAATDVSYDVINCKPVRSSISRIRATLSFKYTCGLWKYR